MAPLARPYLAILANLAEAGGSGDLDHYGRVTVGTTKHPIAGDTVAWLILVSRGFVAGADGKIILTEAGRIAADKVAGGYVREASA